MLSLSTQTYQQVCFPELFEGNTSLLSFFPDVPTPQSTNEEPCSTPCRSNRYAQLELWSPAEFFQLEPLLRSLTTNNLWLLEHMVSIIGNTFGILNMLTMPRKTQLQTFTIGDNDDTGEPSGIIFVPHTVMSDKLAEVLRFLQSYREYWGTERFSHKEQARKEMIQSLLSPRYVHIVQLIVLLQLS